MSMDKNDELVEVENRHCPICGDKVKGGSPLHRCSKKKLREIENKTIDPGENLEHNRTYDDRLKECEEYFNYDKEEDEADHV